MPDVFYRFYHRSEKNACPDLNGLCPRPSIYIYFIYSFNYRIKLSHGVILASPVVDKFRPPYFLARPVTSMTGHECIWRKIIRILSSVLTPGVMVQNCSLSVRHCSCLFLFELALPMD